MANRDIKIIIIIKLHRLFFKVGIQVEHIKDSFGLQIAIVCSI